MYNINYKNLISIENILETWESFICGKRMRNDVIKFQASLGDNISSLHYDLVRQSYKHGDYVSFRIADPKLRDIHKASVRDRILHHLIFQSLYNYFDTRFIFDVYSSRSDKGLHKALNRFRSFARKASKNHSRSCYVLKCDIKKFFASIDHVILGSILARHITDNKVLDLVNRVLLSFYAKQHGVGLPLGNVTSQLLVNIYMHEFDMFIKQELRVKYYIRYADDFIIFSENIEILHSLLPKIIDFLQQKLMLELHPKKVSIKTVASGVDFLGWIHFPCHRQIRTSTKRKIKRALYNFPKHSTINSYRGLLKHGDTYKLRKSLGIDE